MSSDIKRVGDAGVHTVEGNLAGSRAAAMTRQREKQRQEYEAQKEQIKKTHAADLSRIDSKFSSASDQAEQEFRRRTVGLVSAEEFRKAREEELREVSYEERLEEEERKALEERDRQVKEREQRRKRAAATLSFAMPGDDEEEEEEEEVKPAAKRSLKDPHADTSFLPDPEREKEIQRKREELKKEWLEQQEIIKNELLEVTYSYWDGSGHRKVITVKKGSTVGAFLSAVQAQLKSDFHEVRSLSPDDLLYVKEDLIIPHHLSFYDMIVTKARGKSGPLFHFDVHDDVRLRSDARVEKDESHPGKVVDRRWYEKNKHIFPASRWEIFDPSVSRDNIGYSIHGNEVIKK
eukprot:gene1877-2052_t